MVPKLSITPSASEAASAPRAEPSPPSTMMASALYAGTAPMVGSTRLFRSATIVPATAASAEPMKKLR